MQLLIGDQTIDDPTREDLARAIPDRRPEPDAWITLSRSDSDELEAEATEDGHYALVARETAKTLIGKPHLDPSATREVFELYLADDPAWRSRLTWETWTPPPGLAMARRGWTLRETGMLIAGPIIIIAIAIFGETALEWFAKLPLPEAIDSTPARIALGFFAACVAVFLVALTAKLIETRRTARWTPTTGRVVRSQPGFALTRSSSTDIPRNERAADIAYEYQVAGVTHLATRISLAEKIGEDEIPALLTKYPQGKTVTVYYDPADPSQATLERDLPPAVLFGCLGMLAGGLVILAGIMYAATIGPDMLQRTFPNAIVPLVFIFGLGGALMAVIALTSLQQIRAAASWPKAMATITQSDVHSFEKRVESAGSSNRGSRMVTQYMPVVEYTYKVAGKTYASRSIRLDTELAGGQDYARKLAAAYPVGKIVQVRYDPANPQRAAIEIRSGLAWGLLVGAIVLLLLAWWATGTLTGSRPWPAK